MPFKYSCFISYRHGQRATAETLVSNLYEVLAGEIGLWLNEEVFLDRQRLNGGDFYNEALAQALCQSVCMIMLFTPIYFDVEYPYCAREYRAMESLERMRLQRLGSPSLHEHGLIIPIVCRGKEELPAEIKARRQYFDFEKYYLGGTRLPRSGRHKEDIRQIAQYIRARYRELTTQAADLGGGCAGFGLPAEDEVRQWVAGLPNITAPLPGRLPFQ